MLKSPSNESHSCGGSEAKSRFERGTDLAVGEDGRLPSPAQDWPHCRKTVWTDWGHSITSGFLQWGLEDIRQTLLEQYAVFERHEYTQEQDVPHLIDATISLWTKYCRLCCADLEDLAASKPTRTSRGDPAPDLLRSRYTIEQAASILEVSRATVYRRIEDRRLEKISPGMVSGVSFGAHYASK